MNTEQWNEIKEIIRRGLAEDIRNGDVTTNAIVPPDKQYRGQFFAKQDGIIAGMEVVAETFREIDRAIHFHSDFSDGAPVKKKDVIATISGNARAILSGERLALNIFQRMSGIATQTHAFVQLVAHTPAKILDTRKTAPGLRVLDKLAVKIGGGTNHRIGLFDMVMIKDNHITAAGGITAAVAVVKERLKEPLKIEVEVKNMNELKEALQLPIDRIMLDNMPIAEMRRAVELTAGKIALEASGNVSLQTVKEIAETGVDYISIGQLTHSVKALDISLLLKD